MNCKIWNAPVVDGIVVMTFNSNRWSPGSTPRVDQFIISYCHEIGMWQWWGREVTITLTLAKWGMLRVCEWWGCWEYANGGAGVCWQTVEDGLWSFPNVCVWICWGWGNSVGAEWATMRTFCWEPMGGRRGRDRKPNSVGGRGEAETESLMLGLVVLELLARGWWWRQAQSLIQGWLQTHISNTWLRECQPWGSARLWDLVKETHCVCRSTMEIYFCLVLWFFIFLFSILLFLIFEDLFRIAKWWWLPWVTAVGLVGHSHRVQIAKVPAAFGERWGRVGRMMAREWPVTLKVCGVWVGERCWVP